MPWSPMTSTVETTPVLHGAPISDEDEPETPLVATPKTRPPIVPKESPKVIGMRLR